MSTLAELEAELAQQQDDLNTCHEMLQLDPTSADALETIPVLEAAIADLKAQIATKKAEQAAAPPQAAGNGDVPPPPPKYDMSKHPKFRDAEQAATPTEEPHPTVFNVRDTVMARFSEDKQWYQATIIDKTGSPTDPVYKVTFKGYGNTETKRKHEIRVYIEPTNNAAGGKKRKADGSVATPVNTGIPPPPPPTGAGAAVPPPPASTNTGSVISAAPSIDTTLVKKREPSKVSDGPTRLAPEPKKLKGSKALDKQKSSWQDFQKTGPKKKGAAAFGTASKAMGKDSQFRTPDLPGAKVGFTGSGRPMQKDQKRSTWKFDSRGNEET